ncbi:potassium channel family protein [Kangiella sp. TOML190]|uniref:potassium channel family protein n=1 Tax=Kangiella sp. TOML190 TaxID=2931351 RepID=UPI00203FAAED|nr:potassium channel family protein [Kangiella sp. TOML190]
MLLTFVISLFLIFLCVAVHYEALHRFDDISDKLALKGRIKVGAGSVLAIAAHTVEVWLFGIAHYFLVNNTSDNFIMHSSGKAAHGFMESIYFSFISYTSLGYGDLVPEGPIRFMVGTECLLGLVLIAWTASFLYLKMERYWKVSD